MFPQSADSQDEDQDRLGDAFGILAELEYNLVLVKTFKVRTKVPAPKDHVDNVFDLFQTSAWNMFCSRVEMENIEILYQLGATYHRLQLFNEAMKNESTGRALAILLGANRKFLEEIERDIESLTRRLKDEQKRLL